MSKFQFLNLDAMRYDAIMGQQICLIFTGRMSDVLYLGNEDHLVSRRSKVLLVQQDGEPSNSVTSVTI